MTVHALAALLLFVPTQALPVLDASGATSVARAGQDDPQKEFERRKKEAGEDVEKLWDLYLWCDAYGLEKEGRTVLRAIVRADPDHKEAREKLGHVYYDGQWFTSERALEKYKKEEAERKAKEEGLVRYEGEWVSKEDVPFLERGMVRDDDGRWVSKEEHEKLKAGWRRQDLLWVSPEELPKLEQGLWKCDEEWLELEAANRYHAKLESWWQIPDEHFLLFTTCEREVAKKALEAMGLAYRDLVRLFGVEPRERLPVVLLKDTGQYGRFAAGVEGERAPTEVRGLSSVHHAYLADAWFDEGSGDLRGAGVAYWDATSEAGNRFGPLAARHAAAQSFLEGIDPSPETEAKIEKTRGMDGRDYEDFWKEKRLPEWLRYGAAAYVERYFIDGFVKAGGDPFWARKWSVENIAARGGLRPLAQVFDAPLTSSDPDGSSKLINERGLVVAFVLDGECEPVGEAHAAFKEAMASGDAKQIDRSLGRLRRAVEKHESELRQFAGLQ